MNTGTLHTVKKNWIWGVVGFFWLSMLGLAWAPYLLQRYVERHYPGITIKGGVKIRWHYIELIKVNLDRPNIKGHLDSVIVDHDKKVWVQGGDVDLTLLGKASADAEETDITAEGLHATIHKGSVKADLDALRFDSKIVCFKKGTISYEPLKVTVTNGCMARDKKSATADLVSFPFLLPFPIPQMERAETAEISGLSYSADEELLSFNSASIRPLLATEPVLQTHGHSTLKGTPEDILLDVSSLTVNHPWVSPTSALLPDLSLMVPKGILHGKEGVIRITVNGASIRVDPSTNRIEGDEECNTWVKAMPQPVPEAIMQAMGNFTGRLSFEVKTKPTPSLSVKNQCRFQCNSDLIKSLKSGRFEYEAYDKDNHGFSRRVGPLSKDWVSIMSLPPSIPKAFVTLEDPGFNSHNGIITQALENSLRDDLKLGKFFRGGSTITMQLAKNLWLTRDKTISRKAQEALLTTALETCLSKAEILEFYLNAVEFGPNLYGIGPASQHYFHKSASQLEPDEAFYLASLMPHPRTAAPPTAGVMARTRKLMSILADKGYISDQLIPIQDDQVDSTGWESE